MVKAFAWFSCGASSAVAAKHAIDRYPEVEVVYCDTSADEHPDNQRFLREVERWLGRPITFIRSQKYRDIYDVFDQTGWLVGRGMAKCSTELKKIPRQEYAPADALHILGMTYDEPARIERFERQNPELNCAWVLRDLRITKQMCVDELLAAHIDLPAMYKLGYNHNNCLGCVKGKMGYWNKIRVDFPDRFERMARQERKMNVQVIYGVWLDELSPDRGIAEPELQIECGLFC